MITTTQTRHQRTLERISKFTNLGKSLRNKRKY